MCERYRTLSTATVVLNGDHAATVTLDYNSLDNTAHAGTDYTATHGTLTFAPHVGRSRLPCPSWTTAAVPSAPAALA